MCLALILPRQDHVSLSAQAWPVAVAARLLHMCLFVILAHALQAVHFKTTGNVHSAMFVIDCNARRVFCQAGEQQLISTLGIF